MMKSLEMKSEPSVDACMTSSFPSFYVCDDQMPEIADWEADGEYVMTITVRVASKTQQADLDGIDTDSRLEVLSYEIPK